MATVLDDEKAGNTSSTIDTTNGPSVDWNPQDEKDLVRKIDLRIFPVLILLFILNFIDRSNFANARLKGLEKDLKLSDVEYQTCISILLVGYVSMQVPSNIFLNYISKPSLYLCSCVAVWGVISACTAATKNAAGAIMCRFFLGVVEAAFFPGCIFYLSRWYTRKEMQLRVTILNAGNLAAQAFGGLIAAGVLTDMGGKADIAAWRWLFIIEGAITICIALLAMFILPDYPSSTNWLSGAERFIAQKRLIDDVGAADEDDSEEGFFHGLRLAVSDPKVWALGFTYFLTIMGLSFSFFFPSITQALGYNTTDTLLLTAPPWIWAVVISLPNAWHADRTGERFFHYLWPAVACMVGYIISMATNTTAPRYFAMFLMTTGYASGFLVLAWISNTIPRTPAKRAAAIGIINAMGNIGSIPGTYIWRAQYAPDYVVPFGSCLAILGFACIIAFGLRKYLKRLNKKLDQHEDIIGYEVSTKALEDSAAMEQTTFEEAALRSQGFRYLY